MQPRHPLRHGVEHLAVGVPAGHPLGVGREARDVGVPALGQGAPLHVVELLGLLGVLLRVPGEQLLPLPAQRTAALGHPGPDVLDHLGRHPEGLVLRPAVEPLGRLHLVDAEGLAVRRVRALLVGRPVADHAVHHDQGRAPGLGPESLERRAQRVQVVGVGDVLHSPAVAGEPGRHVLGEGQAGGALDGDPVVVVDPAQVAQLQVPGQRGRLGADALHQAAVPGDRVHVVVEQLEARPVEGGRLPDPGDGHAHAGGDPGAQRAGGALHPGGPAVLGVTRALGVQLSEALQVLEPDRRLAERLVVGVHRLHPGQVQQRVEQRRRVPRGEHEPIPVGPDRQLGVEAKVVLPERVGHRRQRHRGARVPGVRRLHRVHRQGADRVDRELVDRLVGGRCPSARCRGHLRTPVGESDVPFRKRQPATVTAGNGPTVGPAQTVVKKCLPSGAAPHRR